MTQGAVLQSAIVRDPGDDLAWLALADWLEEDGQQPRAELLRLTRHLRGVAWDAPQRPDLEHRVVELLAAGVAPANPEMANSIGMRFRLIPSGKFLMGAADGEEVAEDEKPRREVTLTRGLWVGVTPVTQRQYEAVMGTNPSHFHAGGDGKGEVEGLDTADFPVECVSWHDAVAFCEKLGAMADESGHTYRLPTEAEWEYFCRGGAASITPFHFGHELNGNQANCDGTEPFGTGVPGPYLGRPCPVGRYPANAFGLYDLHGQVWGWCADWYGESYDKTGPPVDPGGPPSDSRRVSRGGSWFSSAEYCRAACRNADVPGDSNGNLGLRLSRVPSG